MTLQIRNGQNTRLILFFVESGYFATYGEQQCSCNHDKQWDTRTEKGSVGGSPEFDFINVGWRFAGVKVERVCTMAANYGEHGYQTNDIQPYHMFSCGVHSNRLIHNLIFDLTGTKVRFL